MKKNVIILSLLVFGMVGCAPRNCIKNVEIPYNWHSPLAGGMSLEDPRCFRWWVALNDPLLTYFIEQLSRRNPDFKLAAAQSREQLLQAANSVSAELAINYIELRGLQQQLKLLERNINAQRESSALSLSLEQTGFINAILHSQSEIEIGSLLTQQPSIKLEINKRISAISVLLGYYPGELSEAFCDSEKLPEIPCCKPIGTPIEFVYRNPDINLAWKEYKASGNSLAFYNYQKTALAGFKDVEDALAEFYYDLEKSCELKITVNNSSEAYKLTKDLYDKGFKSYGDVQNAFREFVSHENALIQSKTQLLIDYVQLYKALTVPLLRTGTFLAPDVLNRSCPCHMSF